MKGAGARCQGLGKADTVYGSAAQVKKPVHGLQLACSVISPKGYHLVRSKIQVVDKELVEGKKGHIVLEFILAEKHLVGREGNLVS